jgi:leucyl aminopeptidase
MSGKTIEIINTDAEGRLCMADAIEYFNIIMKPNMVKEKTLLLDIATLTGNAMKITSGYTTIASSNEIGKKYAYKLMELGDNLGEYVDYLKLYKEYDKYLKSDVADIMNYNNKFNGDAIMAANFLNYFCDSTIPWIHMDIAGPSLKQDSVQSYGILLLSQFISTVN